MAFAINIEQFRLVDGYDNYQVSSHGRVRNCVTDRIMNACIRGEYLCAHLSKDGKCKNHQVHRLVAFAFCENQNNKNVVDHIDRIKTNNV